MIEAVASFLVGIILGALLVCGAIRRPSNWHFILLLFTSFTLPAAPRWLLRASQGAWTASQATDIFSSRGLRETNPVLGRGHFGARQIGVKVSIAVGWLVISEFIHRRRPDMDYAIAGERIPRGLLRAANDRRNIVLSDPSRRITRHDFS